MLSTAKYNQRRKKRIEQGLNDSQEYMKYEEKYVLKGDIKKTIRRYFLQVINFKMGQLRESHGHLIDRL